MDSGDERDYAEEAYNADLLRNPDPPADFPTHCWCGRPVQRGSDHECRQCAPHCELDAYRAGRPSPRKQPVR